MPDSRDAMLQNERRLQTLAHDYALPVDTIVEIEDLAAKLAITLMQTAANPTGIQRAHQTFESMLQVATRGPDRRPVSEVPLAEVMTLRAANIYDKNFDALSIGDLLNLGPVPLGKEEGGPANLGARSLQTAWIDVARYLVERIEAGR